MLLNVADFDIELEFLFERTKDYFKGFEAKSNAKPCVSFSITEQELEQEKNCSLKAKDEYFEFIALQRKISEWLPLHNTILLHSATFCVDNKGVALAAPSGTGKSTHLLLWQKLLGERLTIINGDKPFIRFIDNVPVAFGSAWRGKERLGGNSKARLCHICFIERAKENSCEEISKGEVTDLLFRQIYLPKNPQALQNTLALVNELINTCQFWKIKCNMDISAAQTAYDKIFG